MGTKVFSVQLSPSEMPLESTFVPTPFQHLVYAHRVYRHPSMPVDVRRVLEPAYGAYLLGATAADIQSITGQSRVETHFYRLTDLGQRAAVDTLFTTYPAWRDPARLDPAHAAFVTGYLVHLIWDELWAEDIFIPFYRDAEQWPDRLSYFLHHNALRVLLDREAYKLICSMGDWADDLRRVTFQGWLPFAPDWALERWRIWLVEQLENVAQVQTAEVFAARMHVPVARLEGVVNEMVNGTDVTSSELGAALLRYEARALAQSVEMVSSYLESADRLEGVYTAAMHGAET